MRATEVGPDDDGGAVEADDLASGWRGGWSGSRDEQFTAFMRGASPVLGRLGWLLTGDRHHAEELVQQALVRTYAAWPRASADDPMAYARRVMANARIDSWRKLRREVAPLEEEAAGTATSPSREHALAERDALVRALRQLSARRRRVVVLRYLMDLSEREVADDLDVSVGTVKSTAARGLAQLRGLLTTDTSPTQPSTLPATTRPGGVR
ncbi:SigE family RNA polymerase sigma factor [Pseudokineococcus marinus]|nr:SigE family RNA polymerase sigma factor [Pseudokineococcus marinus]